MKMTGTVENIERLPSSKNGNPRWLITLNRGNVVTYLRTRVDSTVGYTIYSGMIGKVVNVDLDHLRNITALDITTTV